MPDRLNPAESVRHVRYLCGISVRHQTRANTGLCGMCGINRPRVYTPATRTAPTPDKTKTSRVHETMPHMPHMPHIPYVARANPVRHAFTHTAQPAQKIGGSRKMNKSIACGPENVIEFNAALRASLPAAHSLARALHQRGMIDGLRGARIGPVGGFESGVVPVLSDEAEKREQDRKWAAGNGAER